MARRIHYTPEALKACSAFPSGIPYDIQTPKMAYIFRIANVWSVVKTKVLEEDPKTEPHLKLCWRLVSSIPDRLQAVVDVDQM